MKSFLRLFAALVLTHAGYQVSAQNQFLSPLRPEQDPCGAIPVCGTGFTTDSSYSGPGASITPAGCMGEGYSMWLRVDVVQSGTIVFTISPATTNNDYDFAVFQSNNCTNLGAPIRCNANNNNPGSNINGQVGLNTTSFLTNVPGGTFGSSYLQQITAVAPSTYYILIDNAAPTYPPPTPFADGFTIDFTGSTALFSIPPAYDSIPVTCNNTQGIQLFMAGPVACGSIAANGSDFVLSPPVATVSGAAGIGCIGGLTNGINLTFSSPLPPGTYKLKPAVGTDGNTILNSCGQAQSLTTDSIVFNVVAPLTVNAGADRSICIGMSSQLTASVTGGGVSNAFVWTPATGLSSTTILNPVATPTANTTYTLTVTPNNLPQCAVSDAVIVNVLQGFVINTPPTTLCRGQSLPISVTGDPRYTYLWTPATGLSSTSTPNTTATPDTTTTYTLRASFPGCPDSTGSIKLTVEPVPVVNVGPDTVLCYYDVLQMKPTVSPTWFTAYSYSWSPAAVFDFPNSRNPRFVAYDTVTAKLVVTTPNGCKGEDSAVLTVIPKIFSLISADTGICPRDSAQLRASGAVKYVWTPARYLSSDTVAEPLASPVTSTLYTVITTNSLGCRDTQSVQVTVHPGALIDLPDSVRIYPGETVQLDPRGNALYFKWFPPYGLSADSIANPIASPEVNTRYFVTASTEWGCRASDSMDVFVDPNTMIDVPNAFTPGSSPNALFRPSRRGLATIAMFRVFNRWGQEVYRTSTLDEGWDGRFHGEPQPLGVYIWELDATTQSGRRVKKQGNVTLLR